MNEIAHQLVAHGEASCGLSGASEATVRPRMSLNCIFFEQFAQHGLALACSRRIDEPFLAGHDDGDACLVAARPNNARKSFCRRAAASCLNMASKTAAGTGWPNRKPLIFRH